MAVEIYTSSLCGYCFAAKRLLDGKGVSYREYSVDGDADLRAAMTKRADGQRTVPQIFIGDTHVGGCDDLYDLERTGGLDPLLAAEKEAS